MGYMRDKMVGRRSDMSRYFTHLMRDDNEQGGTAKENFIEILRTKTILALNVNCLHAPLIMKEPLHIQKKFRTVCFTATPLQSLRHLTKKLPRKFKLKPYGFIFRREQLVNAGVREVKYINSYGDQDEREAYDRMYEIAKNGGFTGKMSKALPYLSAMHQKFDYDWEREWRHVGDFTFEPSDLVGVVLPEEEQTPLRHSLNRQGIAIFTPGMNLEELFEDFSAQKTSTKIINRFMKSKT